MDGWIMRILHIHTIHCYFDKNIMKFSGRWVDIEKVILSDIIYPRNDCINKI